MFVDTYLWFSFLLFLVSLQLSTIKPIFLLIRVFPPVHEESYLQKQNKTKKQLTKMESMEENLTSYPHGQGAVFSHSNKLNQ